ncbi:MAG TPA: FecR family protein [Elusimicrobiota bacterium]|jgi:hypothetical protein|nr:FecR family protein [Elusimicrobiota bacterium]
MRRFSAAALSLLLAAPAAAQAPSAFGGGLLRIGAAGGVSGKVVAQEPGAAVGRVVQSGKPLYLNDHVTTDAGGRLQVLLLDETVFTLGPNSDMVLDTFVYDPSTGAGKVAARVTKGVFRFVTGRVAQTDPARMKITLPNGTIGVRGTIVIGEVASDRSTAILLGPGGKANTDDSAGAIVVEGAGVSRYVSKPGRGVTIRRGEPPSKTQNLSGEADRLQGLLEAPMDPKGQRADAGGDAGPGRQSGDHPGRLTPSEVLDGQLLAGDQLQILSQTAQDIQIIDKDITQWEQLPKITLGIDQYNGSGTLLCDGCTQASSADFIYTININFTNRTIGGGISPNSFIELDPNGTMELDQTTTNINAVPFGSAGNAKITLKASDLSDPNFAGTTITLKNGGGIIARDANVTLKYVDPLNGYDVKGTGTGSRAGGN